MNPLRQFMVLSWWVVSSLIPVSAADLLIITPSEMQAEADRLASLHRDLQGLDVMVAVDTDIAPEPDADAVKAYVRQAYGDGLRYLLLIGEGYGEARSDAWYGMLSSDVSPAQECFTQPDIAVGRIPASDRSYLADYVDKARRYLDVSTSRYSNDVLIACDNGDSHEHLDRAERLAAEFPDATVHKAYIDLDRLVDGKAVITHNRIVDALREGVGIMMYAGHGNATSVTGEGLWDAVTASAVVNVHFPWAFFSSCGINSFRNFEKTLAEAMIYNRDGGAIGVIAATETVYSSYNQEIALAFLRNRNTLAASAPIGDIWLATQRECIAAARKTLNGSYGRNVIAYTLAGDPALPCHVPTCSVSCTVPQSVRALERFNVSGYVESVDDGSVEVVIYAPAERRLTLGQSGDTPGRPVIIDDVPLWRGVARVADGRFDIGVTLPESGTGDIRAALHFRSDSGEEGYCKSGTVRLLSAGSVSADDIAPEVTLRYDGGYLTAETSDEGSGVNSCASMFGSAPSMTVDGSIHLPVSAKNLDEGVFLFTADARHLAPGRHEACFMVSDNAGNRTESHHVFTVSDGKPTISLVLPEGVIRDNVDLSWSHDMTGDVEVTLIVTDLCGNTVSSEKISGAESCELDVSGMDSGIYLVRLLATDGLCHISAEPRRITVIR